MLTSVNRGNSLAFATLALCLFSGCSTTPNTPVAPSSSLPRLELKVSGGETEVLHFGGGVSEIAYRWCYDTFRRAPSSLPAKVMTIRKAENTVIGADGSIYSVSSASFEGQKLSGSTGPGFLGCPTVYRDRDLARPLATTYRMRIDYTIEGEAETFTVSAGGTFTPRPPPP